VEIMGFQSQIGKLRVGDFDRRGLLMGVDGCFDDQAGMRGGACDQVDNRLVADQRLAAPVLRYEAEQPVLCDC
jgi:hypothetical protein